MAEFLDENFGAQTSPVNLDDLVATPLLPTAALPQSATRSRAATAALLSDPKKAIDNYQLMMAEAGDGSSATLGVIKDGVMKEAGQGDIKGVMSVLSDPSVPLEIKQKAIDGVKNSQFLKDTPTALFSKSLAAPSQGENREQEDARLSSADAIKEIYDAREQIQGLVNAHGASLQNESTMQTIDEMGELYLMPFGNNINAGKIAGGVTGPQSVWQTIKRYALAGSTTASLRERLASIPPSQRVEFAQSLLESIKTNSGIIFSNDNQFAQFDKASTIFDEGGYSSTQEFLDNVSPLFDVIGLGQVLRGGSKAAKVAGVAERAAIRPEISGITEATIKEPRSTINMGGPSNVRPEDLATVTGRPTAGAYDASIASLEAEKASLLGSASGRLENGAVASLREELKAIPKPPQVAEVAKALQAEQGITSKAAKAQAREIVADAQLEYNSRTGRINNEITRNSIGADAEQRIAELDKQIALLQKNNTPVFLQKTQLSDAISRIELNSIVRAEHPAAPAYVVGSANPQQGRNLFDALYKSQEEEVARGLYGTTKTQAIINETAPQVATESGKVTTKIPDVQRNLRQELHVPEELIGTLSNIGANNYTPLEKAQAKARVANNFAAAEGLTINESMSSFKLDGGRINIGAVYGTADGSFLRAEDAFNQAKVALRGHGILDSEIEILKRQGLDHVPVSLDEVRGIDGDYLVRVNTFHDIDPTDVVNFDRLDVKRNVFDRIGRLVGEHSGSLTRWLFDAASTLHPQITGAASVASDQTARLDKILLELAGDYSDKYAKLPKERKAKIDEYIREANYKGIKFDRADLTARGFDSAEIDALNSWRTFWDGHFYLENYDLVRTLNSQGFQLFENQNTKLYAKPIAKNQNVGNLYDPATDSVITHTKAEGDALYNAGGSYAALRRPTDFNGVTASHMIVRNTPTEYVRKIRDSDQVLNYRDGYYQLSYKAPRFVDQTIRDSSGAVSYVKTIAVAGDTREATQFADRMASTQGIARSDFNVRGDARALRRDDDAYWDLQQASGRIAQRHRGKLLEDAAGLNQLGDGSHIVNPVDSAIRAASSIAGRTVSRPMIEAAKARFLQQFEELLPPNGIGGRRYPRNVGEISLKGAETSSRVADARTTYEYINYLENGYINSADEVFKAGMNAMAEMLGKYSLKTDSSMLSKAEKVALGISEGSPTSIAKRGVFFSYIGSNFLRQLIVQPHQVLRTFSYNPTGWLQGSIQKRLGEWAADKMGIGSGSKFTKFVDESGLLDAVDKSNLVRGTLKDAADATNVLTKGVQKTGNFVRRIGFDTGESANLLGHAAAVYDRYERKGLNLLDKSVRDQAYSEIRAISYDMNFAGDMVYNQTTPAMVLQFMQVPHKAFLQMTNRRIPAAVRARMVAADIVMWGGPTALIASTMTEDILPDNPELREAFTFGLESMLYNHMFRTFFDEEGEHTNIDFSSLQPFDTKGWQKFFTAMMSGGFTQMLTNSPAGQLFAKEGGRTQNAIASMGRYFGIVDDYDDAPETFLGVMDEVAKISSLYSNAVKGKIMLDAQKKVDQYGATIDKSTSRVEAWAQMLGFGTADSRDFYEASINMSKDVKAHKDETLKVYNDVKRYYYEKLQVENTDPIFIQKVTGRIMKVFENDPVALAIIAGQLQADLQGPDAALMKLFMTRSGIPTIAGLKAQVQQMPIDEETKKLMMQRIDDVAQIRQSNEDRKK